MTIRQIKKQAKEMVKANTKQDKSAYWYLYISPYIMMLALSLIGTMIVEVLGYNLSLSFLIPIGMGFFTLWYARFSINIIRGEGNIASSIPTLDHFWIYFPIIGINSLLVLLEGFTPIIYSNLFLIVAIILGIIFLPIPYIIVMSDEETSLLKVLSLGMRFFFRTLIFQIRFIPLYFLIIITCGILGFWKYTYIQTTYALYTFDLIKRHKDRQL